MISTSEMKKFLDQEPRFNDITCSLQSVPKLPKALLKETRETVAIARKFNEEVVRPYALELDLKMHADPDYLPYDFVEKANDWGFYTMWLPRVFGGRGYSAPTMAPFSEELASVCLGMANLVGVHYLGVASLAATLNTRLIHKIFKETVNGEKTGQPCLISTAITEPGAGTDVEEVELVDKGNVSCYAEKVKGGYLVNGTKVFISSGHLSTWHILIAYSDLKKPSENTVVLAIKTGMKGFSFGRIEKKMGQKGCPASELVFKDCFVPEENVCLDMHQTRLSRSKRAVTMALLDDVLSASRAGVGAFGTGVARGAFQEAAAFAAKTEVSGKLLINHEWAQSMLAEMYKNVALARGAYVEANYAIGLYGATKDLLSKPMYYYSRFVPRFFIDRVVAPLLKKPFMTQLARKNRFKSISEKDQQLTSGMGSMAKFSGTDAGVKNCQMALEMMGQAGLRHDHRTEKLLRDAKLLQIYEGTNQLNRLNLFKCLVARDIPQTKIFEED
ncbi:MAG: acyl-CoA dehydrogenase family protein [Desulfobacterales bacterium]